MQEYIPILKPSYVTICYGWNDHWAAGFDIEDKKQQSPPQWVLDIQNAASESYLYRATKYLLLSKSEKSREYTYNRQSPTYRVSLDDYRDNLRQMINYCLNRNIKPIILTAPIPDIDPGVDTPMETYHMLYCQIGVFIAEEMNVPVVDAAAMFVEHPEFWDDPKKDFIHYNARGAEFIAGELAKVITEEQNLAKSLNTAENSRQTQASADDKFRLKEVNCRGLAPSASARSAHSGHARHLTHALPPFLAVLHHLRKRGRVDAISF